MSHSTFLSILLPKSSRQPKEMRSLVIKLVGILFLLALKTPGQTPSSAYERNVVDDGGSQILQLNRPVERTLGKGEHHVFQVSVSRDQYVRLVIDQRGLDLDITLVAPDQRSIKTVNNFDFSYGPESIAMKAEKSGIYSISLRSSNKEAPKGSYQITLTEIENDNPKNQIRIDARNTAEAAVREARKIELLSKENVQTAIKRFRDAIGQWKVAEDGVGEANTIDLLAEFYSSSVGDPRQSIELYKQSLTLWRALGFPAPEASVLQNLGTSHYMIGERRQAITYLDIALPIERKVGDVVGELAVLSTLGLSYQSLGDNFKAVDYSNQAIEILPRVPENDDSQARGYVLSNAGVAYWSSGDNLTALKLFNKALPLFVKDHDRSMQATILTNISHAHSSMDNDQTALTFLRRALPLLRPKTLANRNVRAYAFTSLGAVYDRLGRYKDAIKSLEQALSLWRATADKNGEASALNNLGFAYYGAGKKSKGLNYYQSALELARTVPYLQGQSLALMNIGNVYDDRGDIVNALVNYKESIRIREELRTTARVDEYRANFASRSFNVYAAAVLASLKAGNNADAFEFSERARARNFLDRIGNSRLDIRKGISAHVAQQEKALLNELADLEDQIRREKIKPQGELNQTSLSSLTRQLSLKRREYDEWYVALKLSHPEYRSLGSVDPPKLSEIQQTLTPSTTLISYFVTKNKLILFVITKQSLFAVPVDVSEKKLTDTVKWFRSFANLRTMEVDSLRQLFGWLVAPIKQYIKTPIVGIVPHGILHYLPFGALTDGKSYFGDEFSIFYLPSVSVENYVQRKLKPVGSKLLALAQANYEGAPVLTYADEEVRIVSQIYNAKELTGTEASKTTFLSRVTPDNAYTIIHIAAHADLSASSPLFSQIHLGPDSNSNGTLELREVYDLDLSSVSLVVLSACETQLGTQSRGDDIVALNRAFIYAGAPTVIASLWTVDDRATSDLMGSFYRHLHEGMAKAAALREAQRETRKRYPHPYYWAGFVLNGAPE
jgi:CHAT domain-containing protein/Tfp pilus assembly protein PilF